MHLKKTTWHIVPKPKHSSIKTFKHIIQGQQAIHVNSHKVITSTW